ncbi:MAG TPA: hypothetical protein VJB70_00345 [Candidatus Paceibacterota bacterium]
MKKELSIEYAHIYTSNHIGEEQKLSLKILKDFFEEHKGKSTSLVVMVDDYSFPDSSFDYGAFVQWLRGHGFQPDVIIRESQLIPACDEVLKLITGEKLKAQIIDYTKTKKYPCSLFVATWYLLRLGYIVDPIFNPELVGERLLNILPTSFAPFEKKAFEIIKNTQYGEAIERVENKYFEGRLVA